MRYTVTSCVALKVALSSRSTDIEKCTFDACVVKEIFPHKYYCIGTSGSLGTRVFAPLAKAHFPDLYSNILFSRGYDLPHNSELCWNSILLTRRVKWFNSTSVNTRVEFKSLHSPGQYTIFPAGTPKIRILTYQKNVTFLPDAGEVNFSFLKSHENSRLS